MYILEIILTPIIWPMEHMLELYASIVPSMGASILLLAATFSILLLPVGKIAQRNEKRISERMKIVSEEVGQLNDSLKGEKRFLETEKIYEKHNYHPIQSVGLGLSFLVMLPVLVSAIIIFTGDGILSGKSFLFIEDLSAPDGLLAPVNILPLLMSAVTLIDARLRFKDDRQSQIRFAILALVLLVLVHNLASGLVLYWTGSNIMSLILSRINGR